MANRMTIDELREILSDPNKIREDPFNLACEVSRRVQINTGDDSHDLLLRALEYRKLFGDSQSILDSLTRSVGLFPYLNPATLDISDLLAYEFHRPFGMDDSDVVFHRIQREVYSELMDGNNVVLSAPTSFGKSLIIDAIAASEKFKKIVIVVPTIALIDETRRRLTRLHDNYKIITHPNQRPGEKSIYVLTQERVVDGLDLEGIDFFVIDEFYKLHPSSNDQRIAILNHAFYKLINTDAQFYMLGPNIQGIPDGFREKYDCRYIHTDYRTVASETVRIPAKGKQEALDALIKLNKSLDEPTLIYCSSPARVRIVVKALLDAGIGNKEASTSPAVEWISANYHPAWLFARSLERGITYHHGRLPRALSELAVRMFNDEAAKILVCTSTLIEGVNTKAKNVIVFDNKIAGREFDFFTFNNIVGRSGRMFQHFIGRIFLFHDAPRAQLPMIDIPAYTQSEDAPEMFLLQMQESELSPRSRERLTPVLKQEVLPLALMRENHGIEPSHQIDLAEDILSDLNKWSNLLRWHGMPTYDNLSVACDLIHRYFVRSNKLLYGVSSGKQLTYLMNRFLRERTVRAVIEQELSRNKHYDIDEIDNIVEAVLEFVRHWSAYNFPRYLRALDLIQKYIFQKNNLPHGDYTMIATQIENFFLDPAVCALDEYGIPIETGRKIEAALSPDGDLDIALKRLRTIDLSALDLTPFERQLIRDAMSDI